MTAINLTLEQDLDSLDRDQLLEVAKSFRKALRLYADRNCQRASSFSLPTSPLESRQPTWIRAELDSPGDMHWSCFRERNKYPTVIAYNPSRSSLKARSQETLKGKLNLDWRDGGLLREDIDEHAVIYSRLPSCRSNTIHVFVECVTTDSSGSTPKFRISTRKQVPPGYVPHCTIHLKRLNWRTRIRVWTGRIKWLYILLEPESPKNSPSPKKQGE